MALTQSQINFYTSAIHGLFASNYQLKQGLLNILNEEASSTDGTEDSFLQRLAERLAGDRNPFADAAAAAGISCPDDVRVSFSDQQMRINLSPNNHIKQCLNHKFDMINEEINSLTIQTNNKIEQINVALSEANKLDNSQNEQLAEAYIKIAVLEEKNEQLWNLVCQSKVIDCSNIITGQVLNEESEL